MMTYLTCTKHRSYQRKHIHLFLQEIKDLRALVANTPFLQETEPVQRRKSPLHGTKLVDFIKTELEGIRKLCWHTYAFYKPPLEGWQKLVPEMTKSISPPAALERTK